MERQGLQSFSWSYLKPTWFLDSTAHPRSYSELRKRRAPIQVQPPDLLQMEQFTRDCLEIDREANGEKTHGLSMSTSMDQIYERAAKLVKRTLDVEGAIVMDVSHCQVLETMSAESTVSVIVHNANAGTESKTRQLSAEEYTKLADFFAKYPDGRISEGIVPASCRPFLPTHCQYALSEYLFIISLLCPTNSASLAVPIFNIDKRPFALLCAYNAGDHTTPFVNSYSLL